jgi:phenylpropionate dioxygenase-like ring-hydroxylating dioxygenase large terminal subunit
LSQPYRFPFSPFPRGWYRVAWSHELRRGQVMPVKAFARDLVLCRGDDDVARLFDAHCPHLGAHLGYGGRVVGNQIECPFHGWRYDGRGQCVAVPGMDSIRVRAGLKAWHVSEVNDCVMAWFDPDGKEPAWTFPELPEFSDPAWSKFRTGKNWLIRTHMQELAENGIDLAHFPHLHHQQTVRAQSAGFETHGSMAIHRIIQSHNMFGIGKQLNWHIEGTLDVSYYALGCVVNRAHIREKISLDYCVVFDFLPIDGESVRVHSRFSIRRKGLLTLPLLWVAMRSGAETIDQDVPIWENKAYRTRPSLSAVDGPVMPFRKWAQQFYNPSELGNDQLPMGALEAAELPAE